MRTKSAGQRIDVLIVALVVVFVVLIGRLAYLQVMQGQDYQKQAEGNRTRKVLIVAPRGDFFDRNGVVMVTSRPGFVVSMIPGNTPPPQRVVEQTAAILGMNPLEIRQKLSRSALPFEPVRLKVDVGQDVVAKIEERRSDLPGVVVEVLPVRNYLHKLMGAHTVGYVSEISEAELAKIGAQGYHQADLIGQTGLERRYDKEVRGKDGSSQVEVDVAGRMVQVLQKQEPVPGNNLVLTIDYRLQKVAEEALDEQLQILQARSRLRGRAGAVVVMNPQNGDILAMVSRPAFDPNLFIGGISTKNWKEINDNPANPMDNRAISGEYPPGSTFKIVTGAAALELKKVSPSEMYFDSGHHWLVPDKGNAGGGSYGWVNFQRAMALSDNVFFYEMGYRLGIDALEQFARRFGMGDFTGIDLPGESDGLVANRRYKQKVYNEEWYAAETFDAAIGQGFQLATPLQMASLMGQVANGGHRYRPRVVSKILSAKGDLVKVMPVEELQRVDISSDNLKLVREGLRGVAEAGGTGFGVFANFPVPVAGKTGTAENSHGEDHAWFVAFGPFDDPRISVAVIVEQGGYGSVAAGPIARKIMEAAFNLKPSVEEAPRVLRPGTVL